MVDEHETQGQPDPADTPADTLAERAGEHGPPPGEAPRWLDDRRNVDRIFYALCIACGGLVLADFLYHKHAHFDFESVTGFHGMFGFVAYVGLVLTAKQLRKVLRRDEDYYD